MQIEAIIREAQFFIISIFSGFMVLMAYDMIRILRRVIRHNNFFIALEDVVFGIITGIELFKIIFIKNDGILRGFLIAAYAIGMLIYGRVFSKAVVNTLTFLIKKLLKILGFPFRIVCTCYQKLRKFIKKLIIKGKSGKKQSEIVD